MDQLFRVVPRHEWPEKGSVRACQRPGCERGFSLLNKPSNCHGCGMVMCSPCLERQLSLPGCPGATPVPLCHACAVCVAKAQTELESAYLKRSELLKTLQEHQVEAERLLALSSSLRSENEQLLQFTNGLKAENERLKMEKMLETLSTSPPHREGKTKMASPSDSIELSGGKDSPSLDGGGEDNSTTTTTASAGAAETTMATMTASVAEQRALDEQLCKRKKMLDARESALQEALKKVSTDAARVAAQRAQLLEEERNLRKQHMQEFDAVIVEETQRLQNIHLEELAALGEQFAAWLSEGDAIAAATLCSSEAVAALKREHATQIAQLEDMHRARVAETERALVSARESHERTDARREQRFKDDLLVLQNALCAVQRQLEEEKGRSAAAQSTANEVSRTLQEERQLHMEVSAELRERLEAAQTLADAAKQCNMCDCSSGGCHTTGVSAETTTAMEALQKLTGNHIMQAVGAVLSEWGCVADALLSHHSASLSAITQVASTAYLLSTAAPSLSVEEDAAGKGNGKDDKEHTDIIERLSCELADSRRLANELEEHVSDDARKIVYLERGMANVTEELQQLREKLARTEKALVRANGVEKRLIQQLQQQQQQQQRCVSVNGGGSCGRHCCNASTLAFVTRTLVHTTAYADAWTRLVGDALLQHYDAGVLALQKEWEVRSALTRRNAVALEHTTASIKTFQEGLKQREAATKKAEEALRVREREVCSRHGRLLRVSMALQTVAVRLREASASEWTGSSWSAGSL